MFGSGGGGVVLSRRGQLLLTAEELPLHVVELGVVLVKRRGLALVGRLGTLRAYLAEPLFFRKSPHLFGLGLVEAGMHDSIAGLLGELVLGHNKMYY